MVHCNRIIVLYSIPIKLRGVGLIIRAGVPLILFLLQDISLFCLILKRNNKYVKRRVLYEAEREQEVLLYKGMDNVGGGSCVGSCTVWSQQLYA